MSIDSGEFFDPSSGLKLGIGSSAAVATALTQALYCVANEAAGPADGFLTARDAHAAFQGGHGSGVDIAASFSGGLIAFRQGIVTPPPNLTWPGGLFCRFLWSGQPTCTTGKLHKLRDATHAGDSMSLLRLAAEEVASTWAGGAVERIIDSFRNYVRTLRQFSVDHDLGIFDAGHEEIGRAAGDVDLSYKPCGAGGGDVGIVFGTDDAVLDSFIEGLATKHVLFDCKLSHVGAMIERSKEESA